MECLACHTPNNEGARFCAKCGAPLPVAQAAEADPLIGKLIGGRYRISGVLGEGGMGRVYTGEQQMGTSVRKVAVKTLLSQFAKDPQTVARFMREVGTVSELEHPNTIKVFDFGQIEDSGELYIAMELLSGQSLEDALAQGPMQPERVDRILGQVCGSLQEAHDKGIVHRDLKPANIFLTTRAGEEDVVKVLDFGIAKRGDSKDSKSGKTEQKLTQQGTILGTPPYMSPEQFSAKELDARSDLYSLAIVTYEMLTGRLPFDADTPWEWMNRHLSVQPFPFETTPAGANAPHKMKAAVFRALEKDRERRPQNAREFYEELTLGAIRVSMLGQGIGGSSPSYPNLPPQGPGTMGAGAAGSMGARGGGTMMGEPIFQGGVPGAGPVAPGKTMTGEMPPMGGVPTGGGQVYAAPPPAQKSGGGSGALIGILLGVLVLGGGGFAGWYFVKGPGAHKPDDDGGNIDVPSSTATAKESSTSGGKSSDTTSGGSDANASTSGGTQESSTSSSAAGGSTASGGEADAGTAPTNTVDAGHNPPPPPPPPPPASHVDPGCCNSISDRGKKKICQGIVGQVNAGKLPSSSLAGANAQGGHCH